MMKTRSVWIAALLNAPAKWNRMALRGSAGPRALSALREGSSPRPITEERCSMAPEEPGGRGAGSPADQADLAPQGEGLGRGADVHRRSL